jgi:hypothetical protein
VSCPSEELTHHGARREPISFRLPRARRLGVRRLVAVKERVYACRSRRVAREVA